MPTPWIDFKELRAKLRFEQVLRHYKVEVKGTADQHHGFCPLPNHQGKKRSPSFSANLAKGIWQCFGCGAKGNIIDFAVHMEQLDPEMGEDVRTVALTLQKLFCPELSETKKAKARSPEPPVPKQKEVEAKPTLPVLVNAPLDFTLKQLDPKHPYLAGRGFSPETIAHFELGYCGRGMLTGRIGIPLHDERGQLVGYAGRVVDDAAITEDNPRYRFPSKRERDGVLHEFQKSLFLYNGNRITEPVDDLIIVEGFASVWWLWQAGLRNAVALMGCSCSDKQAEIIARLVKPSGHVWLVTDGDEAGERCKASVLPQIATHRFTRWVKLAEGKQPTDCCAEELKKCFYYNT